MTDSYARFNKFNLYFAPDICLLNLTSGAHGKHRWAFAASKSLTVPNSSNYFIILCLPHVGIPDLSMLHQFGGSDVHLSSPAIIALVHNASYLEVPHYFCSRTLFLHPFRVDFIHTRIDIFCLLALSFGNRILRLTRWPQR